MGVLPSTRRVADRGRWGVWGEPTARPHRHHFPPVPSLWQPPFHPNPPSTTSRPGGDAVPRVWPRPQLAAEPHRVPAPVGWGGQRRAGRRTEHSWRCCWHVPRCLGIRRIAPIHHPTQHWIPMPARWRLSPQASAWVSSTRFRAPIYAPGSFPLTQTQGITLLHLPRRHARALGHGGGPVPYPGALCSRPACVGPLCAAPRHRRAAAAGAAASAGGQQAALCRAGPAAAGGEGGRLALCSALVVLQMMARPAEAQQLPAAFPGARSNACCTE